MTIGELVTTLERIAPLCFAEPWDNAGLIIGDAASTFTGPVLLTIDLTPAILDEALAAHSSLILSYHPPIWSPLKRLTPEQPKGGLLLRLLRAGVAVYSPHTALDAAPDGVTDWLCDMLADADQTGRDLGDRRALQPAAFDDPDQTHKIVTFLPADKVATVRDALASVGAGQIGAYSQCSFSHTGAGTFFAPEGAHPAVGVTGQLQTVNEIRLEMVCPARSLPLAVEMLRQFHPYEEPAFDLYPLTPKPTRTIGAGRRLTLDQPATPADLASRLRANLAVDAVKLAEASDDPIERVGVCPGAGADLLDAAVAAGCQLFVTGEMRHHEALAAADAGCSILLAGHTNTERGYLSRYAQRINALAPDAHARPAASCGPIFRTIS